MVGALLGGAVVIAPGLSGPVGAQVAAPVFARVTGETLRALRVPPDAPFTIWCDEDTPLIWPEVLRSVAGHSAAIQLDGEDDLLERLMVPEGLSRMRDYLSANPPAGTTQRRRVVSAFLDKFALADQLLPSLAAFHDGPNGVVPR